MVNLQTSKKITSSQKTTIFLLVSVIILGIFVGVLALNQRLDTRSLASDIPSCAVRVKTFSVDTPCRLNGFRFAKYTCTDGYQGTIGNLTNCQQITDLYPVARNKCQNRSTCPISSPTISPTRYPSPTYYPKPTCIPYPTCIPGPGYVCPAFPIDNSGYWCLPTTYPEPTCIPRPSCLDTEPRCLMPEPIGGWCPPPTPTPQLCNQVFTPARNLTTRECRMFPTSCLPDGWVKDTTCSSSPTAYPTSYPTRISPSGYVCPTPPYCNGRLEVKQGDPTAGMTPCPEYICVVQ